MPVLTATGLWLFDFLLTFSLRMRVPFRVWRHDIFRSEETCEIRHNRANENGAYTFYTLRTSRSSGDLLLTNEELPRVALRRREVGLRLLQPFRG